MDRGKINGYTLLVCVGLRSVAAVGTAITQSAIACNASDGGGDDDVSRVHAVVMAMPVPR
jgi:hypothetical protein